MKAFKMAVILVFLLFALASAQTYVNNPANLEKIVVSKVNKYRSKASANKLEWKDNLLRAAAVFANDCNFVYDPMNVSGQVMYSVGTQNGSAIRDFAEVTEDAIDRWWALKSNYTIQSDQYDNLTYFYGSWEFTMMVWKSSKQIGCSWADNPCDNPAGEVPAQYWQFTCVTFPPGNQWDYFGGNVTCPGCHNQPQTTTVKPPLPPNSISEIKRDVLRESTGGISKLELSGTVAPTKRGPNILDSHGMVNAGASQDLVKRVAAPDPNKLHATCQILIDDIRAANYAPRILWSPPMAEQAAQDANNCSFQYDYFGNYGQTFFIIGYQNNSSPHKIDFVNFTEYAFGRWGSKRVNYTISSDEYGNLTYFENTWEFTQLIWHASEVFGCGWSTVHCPSRVSDTESGTVLQFLCYFDPPGNRWDVFGGNVTCLSRKSQPQTTTMTAQLPPKSAVPEAIDGTADAIVWYGMA